MSTLSLFAMGTLVTLIVAAGLSLLVWGAILDGRYEKARQAEASEPERQPAAGQRRSAA